MKELKLSDEDIKLLISLLSIDLDALGVERKFHRKIYAIVARLRKL